jgi:hypothetical protein
MSQQYSQTVCRWSGDVICGWKAFQGVEKQQKLLGGAEIVGIGGQGGERA